MNGETSEQVAVYRGVPPRPTTWPKVIGIIVMVVGVGGGFMGLWSVASSFMTEMLAKMSNLPPDFYLKWRPFMLGSGVGAVLLATLLFLGGLLLLWRKRFALVVLMGWAGLKVLHGFVSSYFGYKMQQEQMPLIMEQQAKMMEQAGAGGNAEVMGMVSNVSEIAALAGLVFGLLWVMILPLFLFIWFARPKIWREVAGWGGRN